jgi:hypothetical protein
MHSVLVVTATLALSGFAPVMGLTGRPLLSLVAAPIIAAFVAAAAVTFTITTGLHLGRVWIATTIALSALSFVAGRSIRPLFAGFDSRGALLALPVIVAGATAARRGPRDWDTYAIWFVHAKRFLAGGHVAQAVARSPDYAFSHPDYPPAGSGLAAVMSWTSHSFDPQLAYLGILSLSLSATALLSMAIWLAVGRRGAVVGIVLAIVGPVLVFGYAGGFLVDGYMDAIWATLFVAAMLLALWSERTSPELLCAIALLGTAALIKNDAQPLCLVLLLVIAVRARRPLERWCCAAALVLPLWWTLASRHLGARSELLDPAALRQLLALDPGRWDRLPPTLEDLWHQVRLPVAMLAAAAAIVWLLRLMGASNPSSAVSRAMSISLGVLGLAAAAVVGAYLVGPYPIRWWLGTSIDRTTLVIRIGATVVALVAATSCLFGGQPNGADQRSAMTRQDWPNGGTTQDSAARTTGTV